MKAFWIYTLLRIVVFVGSLAIVIGLWSVFDESVPIVWSVVIAFLISGLGSYFLLNRPRAALARHVEARAERMTARIEEMRAKEDDD